MLTGQKTTKTLVKSSVLERSTPLRKKNSTKATYLKMLRYYK